MPLLGSHRAHLQIMFPPNFLAGSLFSFFGLNHDANNRARNSVDCQQTDVNLVAQYRAFRAIGTRNHDVDMAIKPSEPSILSCRS